MEDTEGQPLVGTVLIVDDTEASSAALELAVAAIPGIRHSMPSASSAIKALPSAPS